MRRFLYLGHETSYTKYQSFLTITSMGITISIIIPCYNVEKYVQSCLDSIYLCSVPTEEYEVICIDDCSPDGTLGILRINAAAHNNLRIISHSTNLGLGGARNTGIAEARGQYLWFIDSDDYVDTTHLSEMIELCKMNHLDVLAFNYREVYENGTLKSTSEVFPMTRVMSGIDFVKAVFGDSFVYHLGYVVRFFYNVDYLRQNNLFFPEHVYWEDTVYMPKSILSAERIQSVPYVCYNYRRNDASVSGQYHRSYPAELICQMCFTAGRNLMEYSREISDQELSEVFFGRAKGMINKFWIYLLRTSRDERLKFYSILCNYDLFNILCHFSKISRLFINPFWGKLCIDILAFPYKMLKNR